MNTEPEAPQPTAHEFVASFEGVACCTCGWSAAAPSSARLAHARWQLHVCADLAEARSRETTELIRLARARASELRARRAEVRMQRTIAVTQRANLVRQVNRVRRAVADQLVVRHGNVRYLDRARRMADLDVTALWLGYVGLGGNASFDAIKRSLNGVGLLSVSDFNLLALAINETIGEKGFGRPIDYLVPSAQSAAGGV